MAEPHKKLTPQELAELGTMGVVAAAALSDDPVKGAIAAGVAITVLVYIYEHHHKDKQDELQDQYSQHRDQMMKLQPGAPTLPEELKDFSQDMQEKLRSFMHNLKDELQPQDKLAVDKALDAFPIEPTPGQRRGKVEEQDETTANTHKPLLSPAQQNALTQFGQAMNPVATTENTVKGPAEKMLDRAKSPTLNPMDQA